MVVWNKSWKVQLFAFLFLLENSPNLSQTFGKRIIYIAPQTNLVLDNMGSIITS
jgi:hypothetical protein